MEASVDRVTSKTTYICLDTNVYVFCALAAKDAMNPKLLEKLFGDMDALGVPLLVPEVVLLELPKVMRRERENMREALNTVRDGIDQNDVLGAEMKTKLKNTIEKMKRHVERDIEKTAKALEKRMNDPKKSEVISFSDGDIINEAIRIAIRGDKPSKVSHGGGLLQPDCLIVASLKHFQSLNPRCKIAFCTDNVHDFAQSNGDDGYSLHPDIAGYLKDIEFCTRPTQLYDDVLASESSDKTEIQLLGNAFDAARQRSVEAANTMRVIDYLGKELSSNAVKNLMVASQAYAQIDDAAKKLSDSAVAATIAERLSKAAQEGPSLEQYADSRKRLFDALRVASASSSTASLSINSSEFLSRSSAAGSENRKGGEGEDDGLNEQPTGDASE